MRASEMCPRTLRALADDEDAEAQKAKHFATTLMSPNLVRVWKELQVVAERRRKRLRGLATRAERAQKGGGDVG